MSRWMMAAALAALAVSLGGAASFAQVPKGGPAKGGATKTDPLTICHAFMPAGFVIEDEIARSAELTQRMGSAKVASYWGGP